MEYKKLIFDFDGVIGDTWEIVAKAHVAVGKFPTVEAAKEDNRNYVSKKPNHTRNHSLSDEEMKGIYDWMSGIGKFMHEEGFDLFTDFVHEVESIPTKHKAIVSSGSQNYVIPAVARTNINPTHILAFENHHSKEEKIEIIARDWGADLSEIYYFTDTLADVYELQDFISKDKLIGVSWGFCSKDQLLQELQEQYILDTPKDIHNVL